MKFWIRVFNRGGMAIGFCFVVGAVSCLVGLFYVVFFEPIGVMEAIGRGFILSIFMGAFRVLRQDNVKLMKEVIASRPNPRKADPLRAVKEPAPVVH